jgi:N-acetylneuraminate synthase/N,N'-diacetyllegionaminate synthase
LGAFSQARTEEEMDAMGPWTKTGRLPYLIAEIGGNHEGNFDYARTLCSQALESGADCIKFQIYTGDGLVNGKLSPDRAAHFRKFELTPDQHLELAGMCRDAGRDYSASVWDADILSWIDDSLAFYKIGSGDLTAYPVVMRFAERGKPIVLSTGLSTLAEVKDAVAFIRSVNPVYQNPDWLTVLQCTSMYPIGDADAHLSVMDTFKRELGCTVGYSDHTIGSEALRVAAIMGARVMEFHFTDSREGKTFRDHKVSLTREEVQQLRSDLEAYDRLMGASEKLPLDIEVSNGHVTSFRRALYPARNLPAGSIISAEDLVCLRPNNGIDPRGYGQLIGKRTRVAIRHLEVLDWGMFEDA